MIGRPTGVEVGTQQEMGSSELVRMGIYCSFLPQFWLFSDPFSLSYSLQMQDAVFHFGEGVADKKSSKILEDGSSDPSVCF